LGNRNGCMKKKVTISNRVIVPKNYTILRGL
jgi:hypothetical protein